MIKKFGFFLFLFSFRLVENEGNGGGEKGVGNDKSGGTGNPRQRRMGRAGGKERVARKNGSGAGVD